MAKALFAANSVYALCRIMYSKRLENKDFDELLSCPSVSLAAEKLENTEAYSDVLKPVMELNISRRRLENQLQLKLYTDMVKIKRYMEPAGDRFYEYFVTENDLAQIRTALSSLKTKSESYIASLPVYFAGTSRLDLYKLAEIKNPEQLIELTSETPYKDSVEDAVDKYIATESMTAVYSVFSDFLDKEFLSLTKKRFGKNKKFLNLYKTENDIELIGIFKRLKRISGSSTYTFDISPERLSRLKPETIAKMANAGDISELDGILSATVYKDLADKDGESYESASENYLYRILRDAMTYSTDPDMVVFAYVGLSGIEIKNIIRAIESVRYNLPREQAEKLLTGVYS